MCQGIDIPHHRTQPPETSNAVLTEGLVVFRLRRRSSSSRFHACIFSINTEALLLGDSSFCLNRLSWRSILLMVVLRHVPGGEAGLLLSRGGEGGRGFWTQNLVYQKWPDQIFPIVNFVFSHYGHFGLGRGGRGFWGRGPPPPWVLIILKKPWGEGVCTEVAGGPHLRWAPSPPPIRLRLHVPLPHVH